MSSSFLSSLPATIHIGQSFLVVAGPTGQFDSVGVQALLAWRRTQSRSACNWLLPDRVQRNRGRAMMLVAGRMTATARADIGTRCSSPKVKRGSEVCVQTCDDARQL